VPVTEGAETTPEHQPPDPASPAAPRVVLWTRGPGCAELAALLASGRAARVEGAIDQACVREQADLVVQRKLSSFDLIDVAVPSDFDPDVVGHVVAAIGGGPHSTLAALVAERLGTALGVPATAVSGYRDADDRAGAELLLSQTIAATSLDGTTVQVTKAADLIEQLPEKSLVVLGAAGGNWFQRQLSGPGHRLTAKAPAGAVVVRHSPLKAFQTMLPPSGLSPHLLTADALALMEYPVAPIVDGGAVLGVVRWAALMGLRRDEPIGSVTEDAPLVGVMEPAAAVEEVSEFYDGSPVPLVDGRGMLVGMAPAPAERPSV